MLTTLLVIHGIGMGAAFVFILGSSLMSAAVGGAFGWGGRSAPLWQIVLGSLFWEIPVAVASFQYLMRRKA